MINQCGKPFPLARDLPCLPHTTSIRSVAASIPSVTGYGTTGFPSFSAFLLPRWCQPSHFFGRQPPPCPTLRSTFLAPTANSQGRCRRKEAEFPVQSVEVEERSKPTVKASPCAPSAMGLAEHRMRFVHAPFVVGSALNREIRNADNVSSKGPGLAACWEGA